MSSKKLQFQQLMERCEAVGWPVRRTGGGHFFIRAPNGAAESFPSTPDAGRGRGFRNAEAWCKRNGLLEAEANLSKKKDKNRMKRIEQSSNKIADIATVRGNIDEVQSNNKDFINGVKIIERSQAKIETPITGGKAVPFKNISEVLLEDGSVVYQCDICLVYTADSGISVRAHLGKHRPRNGAAQSPKKAISKKTNKTGFIALAMEISKQIDNTYWELNKIRHSMVKLVQDISAIEADPETIKKAKKFDQLQTLMK